MTFESIVENRDFIVAIIEILVAVIIKLVASKDRSKNDRVVYVNIDKVTISMVDSNIKIEGSQLEEMKSKGIKSSNKDKIN